MKKTNSVTSCQTSCMLFIDAREKNVIRHEKELEQISTQIKQITTGDYVIIAPNGTILAVIERKSLVDFAASLKDGRCNNKQKLIALRQQTGCRILYIIEGPNFPDPDDYFGNISYKHIQSSIFHLMIRDSIGIIQTRDTLHTAKILAAIVCSMDSLIHKDEGLDEIPEVPIETIISNHQTNSIEEITSILTKKYEKTDYDVVREMWGCFPGISVESADEYSKYWSIADIVCSKVPQEHIKNFKLASGRAIGRKALKSLTHIPKLIEVRLLSTIPGISHATATEINSYTILPQLLTYNLNKISNIKVGKTKRNLGDSRAQKILRCFNYKYEAPTSTTSVNTILTNI